MTTVDVVLRHLGFEPRECNPPYFARYEINQKMELHVRDNTIMLFEPYRRIKNRQTSFNLADPGSIDRLEELVKKNKT